MFTGALALPAVSVRCAAHPSLTLKKGVVRRELNSTLQLQPPDPGPAHRQANCNGGFDGYGRGSRVRQLSRRLVVVGCGLENGHFPKNEDAGQDGGMGNSGASLRDYDHSDFQPGHREQSYSDKHSSSEVVTSHPDSHAHTNDSAHEHGHSHGIHMHGHSEKEGLNRGQRLIRSLSVAVGLAKVADLWRDSLQFCLISMGFLLVGAAAPYVLPKALGFTIQAVLIVPALLFVGVPAMLDAARDVAGGSINIHVLMAAAACASVFMGNALEGGLLLAMFSLSHLAEDYFTERAMGDVKALKESNPEFALVLNPFDPSSPVPFQSLKHKQVPVADVEVGAYVLVRAGETVPVDGEVWQGRAMVTVEHLTGEAQPVEKNRGESVPGGARSLDGVIIVKAMKKWQDSTVARIMKLTEEAQTNRPTLQRWLDDFGEQYSRAVVVVSFAVAILGPLLLKWPVFSSPGVRGSIYRALGLMVAASPCALAVAPLAYATAISSCANKGILLKGGKALDALASCDTVAFDKTGTLTTGDLLCKGIEPLHGHHRQEWRNSRIPACCTPSCEVEALAVAAAMERGATHPIARAVVEHSEGKELPVISVDNFESVPGKGLAATITNLESGGDIPRRALLGSLEYIASSSKSSSASDEIKEAAKASVYGVELIQAALSLKNTVTLFHFEDKLKPGAAEVVERLKKHAGFRCLMLTGDHAASAQRVAQSVGITEVYSNLKPEDKLFEVRKLSQQNAKGSCRGLIMVGDGINDAPALAAATVGIVLAKNASSTAVAVADVLLLRDSIEGVFFVIAKAHQTTSLVKQSVALALTCIFFASLPSVLGYLPLWLTVLLHEGGTLVVCVNSVRALSDPSRSWNKKESLRWITEIIQILKNRFKREDNPVLQPASVSAA